MPSNNELDSIIDTLVMRLKGARTDQERNALWQELWTACTAQLYPYARWCARNIREDPNDLLGEAMAELHRQIDVVHTDSVSRWLKTIIYRQGGMRYRQQGRRTRHEVPLDVVAYAIPAQENEAASRREIAIACMNAHREALGAHYTILYMHVVEERGLTECARMLGVTHTTAANRFDAACRELRRCVNKKHRHARP